MAQTWPDARVTGIDSSRRMVRLARRRHGDLPNLTFQAGDGLHLDLAEGFADLVTSLNYMPFPAEVRRILRPAGHVLVASTFQAVGSKAVAAQWEDHGFTLAAQENAAVGSFEIYRQGD
jgi:SAM-dependent methyltransferase